MIIKKLSIWQINNNDMWRKYLGPALETYWFHAPHLFCFIKRCTWFQHENLKGSSYSAIEHHTVNLTIASGMPLDFITGFNKKKDHSCVAFLLIHTAQISTTSPDQAARVSINLPHFPFPSLHFTLTPCITFLNLHNSVIQIAFTVSLPSFWPIPSHSPVCFSL